MLWYSRGYQKGARAAGAAAAPRDRTMVFGLSGAFGYFTGKRRDQRPVIGRHVAFRVARIEDLRPFMVRNAALLRVVDETDPGPLRVLPEALPGVRHRGAVGLR